jgi:SsrA-binding protein
MSGIKVISKNKRAGFDYELLKRFEAGVSLKGTEIKVLREGKVNLNEAYVTIDQNDEVWAYNVLIPQYTFGNIHNHDEHRIKKLLLHKKEIVEIYHDMKTKGLTMVVTMIYFKGSKVKIEVAMARGKKLHDKRASEAKKDVERKLRQGQYD